MSCAPRLRPRRTRLYLAWFLLAPALLSAQNLSAESEAKWLIGSWQGTHTRGAESTEVRIEFGEDLSWTAIVKFMGAELKATGATKVDGDHVTLTGRYITGRPGPLNYSLSHRGETLEGTGLGSMNVSFSVSVRKLK